MTIYSSIHSAADHICRNYYSFNSHAIAFGCANVRVFNTLMRTYSIMNTSDVDCGVSFSAAIMIEGVTHTAVITLYKHSNGSVELRERMVD